jgi:hypothetical protein
MIRTLHFDDQGAVITSEALPRSLTDEQFLVLVARSQKLTASSSKDADGVTNDATLPSTQ